MLQKSHYSTFIGEYHGAKSIHLYLDGRLVTDVGYRSEGGAALGIHHNGTGDLVAHEGVAYAALEKERETIAGESVAHEDVVVRVRQSNPIAGVVLNRVTEEVILLGTTILRT